MNKNEKQKFYLKISFWSLFRRPLIQYAITTKRIPLIVKKVVVIYVYTRRIATYSQRVARSCAWDGLIHKGLTPLMRRDDSQGTKNVTKKRPIAMPKKLAITNKQGLSSCEDSPEASISFWKFVLQARNKQVLPWKWVLFGIF